MDIKVATFIHYRKKMFANLFSEDEQDVRLWHGFILGYIQSA